MTTHTIQSRRSPISDEQYQFLSEGVEQYYEGESCFEAVQKAMQAGVDRLHPAYPVVTVPEGWTQAQIEEFSSQIQTIHTRDAIVLQNPSMGQLLTFATTDGRMIGVDPSCSDGYSFVVAEQEHGVWTTIEDVQRLNPVGIVTSEPDAQGWVNVQYCGSIKKTNCGKTDYCPALDRLEEQTVLRNKRFFRRSYNDNDYAYAVKYDDVIRFWGKINEKELNDSDLYPYSTYIYRKWAIMITFGFFDFPIALPNTFELFL